MDEQFGAPKRIPEQAKERGLILAMPVEKSGQDEFDFDYGDQFGEHIERFDPDFSKVLVRFNPDGDPEMNKRQIDAPPPAVRLAPRARPQVPLRAARPGRAGPARGRGRDTDRFDAELRPD